MASGQGTNYDIEITPVIVNCPPCKYGWCDMKTSNCICESGFHGAMCDDKKVNLGHLRVSFHPFSVVF